MSSNSIRTLFVTIMSYPLTGGTHLRNWQNINIMKNFGPVSIFSIFNQDCNYIESSSIDLWHHYNIDKQSAFFYVSFNKLNLIAP
jgi:hypothetical protein